MFIESFAGGIHSHLLIVLVILSTLFWLAWHNQPAQQHEHKPAKGRGRR